MKAEAEKGSLDLVQMVTWAISLAAAVSGLISFAYANFLTKDNYIREQGSIEKRLDKLDDKMDLILQGMNGKRH